MSTTRGHERPRRRFRPRLWPSIAAAAGLAVLLGLGTWQVHRLHWKEALIAEREARLAAPPLDVAAIPRFGPDLAYRRASAEGRFLHDRELHLAVRTRHGSVGVEVITPMALSGGGIVLVDRGWVPEARADPATRPRGQVAGTVRVVGLLDPGGRPSPWTPDNVPATGTWFYVDVAAMAARLGLAGVRDYVLVAGPAPNPGGLPVGRAMVVDLPNRHLEYAITWYALAVVLAVIYVVFHLERRENSVDAT